MAHIYAYLYILGNFQPASCWSIRIVSVSYGDNTTSFHHPGEQTNITKLSQTKGIPHYQKKTHMFPTSKNQSKLFIFTKIGPTNTRFFFEALTFHEFSNQNHLLQRPPSSHASMEFTSAAAAPAAATKRSCCRQARKGWRLILGACYGVTDF